MSLSPSPRPTSDDQQWPDQQWLSGGKPTSIAGQAAYLAGRAGDTLGLIVVGALSLGLIAVLLICLILAGIKGSLVATLLMLLAIAGVVLAFGKFRRQTRQAAVLRSGGAALPRSDVGTEFATLEAERIQKLAHLTLKAGASLSAPLRQKLNASATAIRDALRATAAGGVLTREAHDARQAADDDLPTALSAYQDLRVTGSGLAYGEVLLSEQLTLIERRMRSISDAQAQQHTRKLEAGRRYLSVKYGEADDLQPAEMRVSGQKVKGEAER
ncbi:hypothetical protein EHF33_04230 [Deinococcus psychrotolerans]|uniref:Uncharacterized protein n=1 Tax=Deinococcus psychrotolerans TaxID=2489213 RepID=A0A3G8YAV1_9DEIO|nr:hypothetical protein [Deinococcus psychrotolerans]AZI42053.1 hypothetical protein EHF33_04230 [Deinococcus psychrotolerans]